MTAPAAVRVGNLIVDVLLIGTLTAIVLNLFGAGVPWAVVMAPLFVVTFLSSLLVRTVDHLTR